LDIIEYGGEEVSTFIVVDSCCDLPLSFVESHKDVLEIIGMPVHIDGFDYHDDLGKTMSHDDLYSKLRQGIMPATAQINTYRFSELFKEKAKHFDTVLYIGFSSGMSGTFDNAMQSIDMVKEELPSADIRVIDSKSASIGQGLIVLKAIEMLKAGDDVNQIVSWIEKSKLEVNHWFAVDDLNYLKSGGRITAAEAAIGTLLSVKPILTVNLEGKLKPYTKVKGRKKSMKFLVDKFKEHYKKDQFGKIIIGHGNVEEDALKLKELLLKELDEELIMITELSATIASHVGPGMLAMSFMGEVRADK
jgi:DegV family protein with EDD domain